MSKSEKECIKIKFDAGLFLTFAVLIFNAVTFSVIKFNDLTHLEKRQNEIKATIKEFNSTLTLKIDKSDLELKQDIKELDGKVTKNFEMFSKEINKQGQSLAEIKGYVIAKKEESHVIQ